MENEPLDIEAVIFLQIRVEESMLHKREERIGNRRATSIFFYYFILFFDFFMKSPSGN